MTDGTTPPARFSRVLKAARRGDEQAWSTLYHWLAPQVLGFLRVSRAPDPEDILGEVFFEVARRIGDFAGEAPGFRAWVFTIARAKRVDSIRVKVRRREAPMESLPDAGLASGDVEDEAMETLLLEDMIPHLRMLTDDQVEVVVLRVIGGFSTREVAEMTGRTVGAVEQLQHRATRALRAILDRA